MRDTVVVFARAPRLGTVKRRLARDIGDRAALRFHTATLLGLLRGLLRDRRFRTVLALTPDGARDRLPVRVARDAAKPGRHWAADGRGLPAPTVAATSPLSAATSRTPTPATSAPRFGRLGSHDAVFGPARDGGYWLVALGPRRPAQPFDNARWSTEHALADTLRNFRGRRVAMLRMLRDVDTACDLPRHPRRSKPMGRPDRTNDRTQYGPTSRGPGARDLI